MNERCSEHVYTGTWGGSSCSLKAKVERDGKGYCTIHDPVRRAEKRAERDRKWEEAAAARKAERERVKREPHICNTCGMEHRP